MTNAELLAEYETTRAQYVLARSTILVGGQAHSIGNRSLTYADLKFIDETIDKLTGQIKTLERGNSFMMHRVVPRDI